MSRLIFLPTILLFMTVLDKDRSYARRGLGFSLDAFRSRLENSKNWLFKRSEIYNGHRYYLSQQDPISRSEESMATCVLYGGYLAEIDDVNEFNFIKSFIKQFSGFRLVLIGGTDNDGEEIWKYRQSKNLVPGFLIRSRKHGASDNCLYLHDAENWLAVDDKCYYTFSPFPTRFLCEIPENAK